MKSVAEDRTSLEFKDGKACEGTCCV
jgi:hypothetical protein